MWTQSGGDVVGRGLCYWKWSSPHPFTVPFAVFMCFFMIYRLRERNTGSEERQRDIKKGREKERKGGRKEGAEGADHSL